MRPRERLIIKLGKSRLGELHQKIIEWNFDLGIVELSNYIKYPRIIASFGIT